MKVYHQTGHNLKWNLDSLKDKVGNGLIFSPVNIDADKLLGFSKKIKKESFLDPQLYLLNQAKGALEQGKRIKKECFDLKIKWM